LVVFQIIVHEETRGRREKMNKLLSIFAILGLAICASMVFTPLVVAMPAIKRPMDLYDATIEGSPPQSTDYSYAYDTASGEILLNTMDTLIQYAGESTTAFIGDVAQAWTGTSGGMNGNAPIRLTGTYGETLVDGHGGIDSGIPITGLSFENDGQPGPDATYYYQYVFQINPAALSDATFWPAYGSLAAGPLTLQDIVYSFQRTLVQDRSGGPQWMLQEPMLDNAAGNSNTIGGLASMGYGYTLANTTWSQVSEVGQLIANAIVANATAGTITFNIMYPGAYAPFLEVLTQTWASVMRQAWITQIAITANGRPDWNGNIAAAYNSSEPAYTAWLSNWLGAGLSPLDTPTMITYGSGPFILTTVDLTNNYWTATRNPAYWRGWPAKFPAEAGVTPAGYVNTITVTWNFVWETRLTMFLDGDCDFCALGDNSQLPQLYTSPTATEYPFDTSSSNYPLPGIQCIAPLPELEVDAIFYTFNINSATTLQTLCPMGTYSPTAIPPDFFGMQENATAAGWSQDIRQAFAWAFDYSTYISTVFAGLATHPATAIIPGLNYYDPTVTGYSYNIANAINLLDHDPVWNTGFTLNLYYNTGNTAEQEACQLEQTAIESLNSHFIVNIAGIPWATYLDDMLEQEVPMFSTGSLADFPDPHDFAFSFYDSAGAYGAWQALPTNWPMNSEIIAGIETPDGPARAAIYTQIQKDAINYCPSFTTDQPIGYHFQQDWVQGYYYNPMYPGPYFYNQWKWYYCPQALLSTTPSGSLSEYNTADVGYTGVVDISSVATAAAAFGSEYGPPTSSNWIYRADVTNDRIVDISDIAFIASCFGESSLPWSTQLSISVSPSITSLANVSQTATLTASTAFASGSLTYNWYTDSNNTPVGTHGPTSSPTDTYTFAPSTNGIYTFYCTVTNTTSYTARSNPVLVLVGIPGGGVWVSAGPEVQVFPLSGVNMTFASVTGAGYAIATTTTNGPSGLSNVTGPYYNFTVQATFSGTVTVGLHFNPANMTQAQESNLQMAQYDNGTWVNIPTTVDTKNNIVYGQTTHFSFIAIH
jgi:peptide/nickel transport system substrate-binding protein